MNPILIAVLIVAGIGLAMGIILAVASAAFGVVKDEREQIIAEMLPGANCGGCGYSGCAAYAQAILSGETPPTLCAPGGSAVAQKIADLLGQKADGFKEKKAVVMCQGNCEHMGVKMEYSGEKTCAAAAMFFGGPRACSYGCIGYGDCVVACQFDAIHVIDGVAVVDRDKCTGCGACVAACPKKIIELIPASEAVGILCKSHDTGKDTRSVCKIGCIACSKCVKECPAMCISMKDNLAVIDYSKCYGCRVCVGVCPTKTIKNID
ncbi:MAG TPA: Fe-S cluster domain-containing protein [Clostridia bacterium]|nr:Fe-S cluster domain-containing protein [Clostridia bacterium]